MVKSGLVLRMDMHEAGHSLSGKRPSKQRFSSEPDAGDSCAPLGIRVRGGP